MRLLSLSSAGGARICRAITLVVVFLLTLQARAQTAWESRDIGSVGARGSSIDGGGRVEVTGSGADIWDRGDEFHFRYRQWTGDGEFIARVTSLENTHAWAKAGLMVREALSSESRNAMMCATAAQGTAFQHRLANGGETALSGLTWSSSFPAWLKIVRRGDTVTGFASANGTDWMQAGTATLAGLPASIYVGLAVTSHSDGVRAHGVFDNIVLSAPTGSSSAPVITVRPTETVLAGSLYTYQIVASNSPTSYDVSGLPAGLTLDPDTGEIQGVCGFNSGTYVVTLRATNASGTGTATQVFEVKGVGPPEMPHAREIIPPADGVYRVGDVLLFRLRISSGYSYVYVTGRPRIALKIGSNTRYADYAWGGGSETHVYSYTVSAADVPAANISVSDTIDLNGGTIQDHFPLWCALNLPQVDPMNIRLEAASASPSAQPIVDMPDTVKGLHGRDFSLQITASNAPTSYGLTFGAVPTRPLGLSFNPNTGMLSGVLQASGNYTLNLSATNGVGSGTKTIVLAIPHEVAAVEMPSRGTYRANDALAFQITFSNPVQIADSPALNLQIGADDRQVRHAFGSGQVHTFIYTVQPGDVDRDGVLMLGRHIIGGMIRDAETGVEFGRWLPGGSLVQSKLALQGVFIEAPGAAPPEITSGTTASGTVGKLFNYAITATNGPSSYAASPIPPGLTLDASSGVISGTPTAAGMFNVIISATNSGGSGSATLALTIDTGDTSPWRSRDIGGVASAGSSSESDGVVTLRGSGADIWNQSDEFHFRQQVLVGDGEIVARVTNLSNTHEWAKAGVMFRESLTGQSRNAMMIVTAGNGATFQYRETTGGYSGLSYASADARAPHWLRLVRSGNTIIGYDSSDGTTWTQAGMVALTLPPEIYVGLAVTSHNDGTLATATFDNVEVRATSGAAPVAPSGLSATATAYDRVNLTWTDNSSGELGFELQYSPNPTGFFSTYGNVGADTTNAAISGLYPENDYYFRVRAFNAGGSSGFSNVASVTTPPYPAPATLGAPTGLTAVASSESTIELSWTDNSSSELGFEVGLSLDGVSYDWGGRTLANATIGGAAGLRAGTTYFFQVRAYQDGGTYYIHSSPSNTASATTHTTGAPPPAPPANPPTNLATTVVSPSQITVTWTDTTTNETGFHVESSVDRVSYSLLTTTMANVTSYSHTNLDPSTTYYYRARATNAGGHSSYSSVVSATTPPPSSGWSFGDIGAVGIAGSNTSSGNTITVRGSGHDVWDATDAFRFVYRAMQGDVTVEAQVSSLSPTHPWAKAGVMIRDSLAADARNVFAFVTPDNVVAAQVRRTTGGTTELAHGGWKSVPYWVRLVRTGGRITAYTSVDGVSWAQLAAYDVSLADTAIVGFAVTSHDNSQLNTAVFTDPFIE